MANKDVGKTAIKNVAFSISNLQKNQRTKTQLKNGFPVL